MTIERKGGRIVKLSGGTGTASELMTRFEKIFEKISKKVLTREKECGIIVKLPQRRAADGH